MSNKACYAGGLSGGAKKLFDQRQASLIMRPHADYLHGFFFSKNLIHKAMLNRDSAGAGAGKIAYQLFIGGRVLKWILLQYIQKLLRFCPKAGGRQFFCILLCLPCEIKLPTHQARSLAHFASGVLRPLRIDSLMPGIESRYSVS